MTTANSVSLLDDSCSRCNSPIVDGADRCPTCGIDIGAPNVRLARRPEEANAVSKRYEDALESACGSATHKAIVSYADTVRLHSGVVVTMPADVARSIVSDPRRLYASYDKMVDAGVRLPATFANDSHRKAVGADLFGSFSSQIVYGALSLNSEGLKSYGAVHCRLREVAVRDRTSFTERNSYYLPRSSKGDIPSGMRAFWDNRHALAVAKASTRITAETTVADFPSILLSTQGSRESDEFIEAHIFNGFNVFAIESLSVPDERDLGRDERMDARIAVERFTQLKATA